ncbi:MAG: hypothetical protein J6Y29_02085 [Clostridiales bacterium]|nr:hypothetical protein [Clostridiales bacterium]
MGEKFAVIDTETNWHNEVMSIGAVIAEDKEFEVIDTKYIVIKEAAEVGGLFSKALYIEGQKVEIGKRANAINRLIEYLKENEVKLIFAYNASFDWRCLPELRDFEWHDILKKAAYRDYNPSIPDDANFCKTGRLKSGYGVENIIRMFGEDDYKEVHNALEDAVDELRIMKYLKYSIKAYNKLM